MISRTIKQLLAAASVGSAILVSAMPVNAGRMFKEEPSRPNTFAGCQPAWGYNQTCWQRFPALPPCDSNGSCYGQSTVGETSYDHASSMYVPQNNGAVVDPGFSTMPHSLTPGQTSPQILAPNAGIGSGSAELHYGSQLNAPSSQAPLQQYSAPPQTLRSAEPSAELPSQQVPPVPNGTLALPPLPAPPEAVPAVPGQTRFQPQYEQLMIGADGRLMTATAMTRNQTFSSNTGRYGQVNRPVVQQQFASPSPQRITGPPVHFADAVTNPASQQNQRYTQPVGTASRPARVNNGYSARTLAKPVSQSQNTQTNTSSRYGVTRPSPSVTVTPGIAVEPLRKTPGSYR
ncbi:MAG: hypothetical protein U0936_22345 [Planctomycetaceae bacterium]